MSAADDPGTEEKPKNQVALTEDSSAAGDARRQQRSGPHNLALPGSTSSGAFQRPKTLSGPTGGGGAQWALPTPQHAILTELADDDQSVRCYLLHLTDGDDPVYKHKSGCRRPDDSITALILRMRCPPHTASIHRSLTSWCRQAAPWLDPPEVTSCH